MATKHKKNAVSAADAVDQQLERYRSMRDFTVTAEPSGGPAERPRRRKAVKAPTQAGELPFVIQKHAASHLHYDFRLGWNGVLKSWAVAKGPSYFPGDKRLAVQVEDHPIEYGGFEGIIPQGQYGGGTVMVWDQGTWAPQAGYEDVDAGLKAGSLKFTMQGSKMKGKWTLVRMGGKAANERKPNWLLIKEHDEFERNASDQPVTEEEPKSAVTGRDLDEIAHNEDHVWNSNKTAAGNAWYRSNGGEEKAATTGSAGKRRGPVAERSDAKSGSSHALSKKSSAVLKGARKEKLPEFIAPELATQVDRAPASAGWLHELKLDGYRIQARKDKSRVQLLTRTGLDWTHRMKTIAAEIEALEAETALLDGEVVVLAEDGTTSFADLQAAFQEGIRKPLTYFAFDLMHLDGHDLRGLPLTERKDLLHELVQDAGEFIRFSEHIEGSGETMFAKACELGAEGIISKRAESRYLSGRSRDWLKLKCIHEQEFVIGGFTLPANGSHGVGALLLGYYESGKLIYAGRTGTGFTQKTHRSLRDQLDAMRRAKTAFSQLPGDARGAIWVKPDMVAQVRFATWTADGLLRQAAFKGLREDKPASEVRREETVAGKTGAASDAAEKPATKGSPKERPVKKKIKDKKIKDEEAKDEKAGEAKTGKAGHAPVRLTHPDKVLDANSKLTKQQLADYYWEIAPQMLAQIARRPLSLVRCPEGSGKDCFYQKHAGATLPPEVGAIDVPDKKTGKAEAYITLDTREALAALAQMSVLEIHPWGSRNEDLEHPDRIIIDLDPDAAIEWKTLAASAAEVRRQLKKLGLESFLKSTGGKGLHVVVPIVPGPDWAEVKQFAHAFSLAMEQAEPSIYVTTMSKAARKGKIYIDYLRNERGSTAVAAYSPRAREGAPVSMPLEWSELKLAERPVFEVAKFAEWKSRLRKDPWKGMAGLKQRIKQHG